MRSLLMFVTIAALAMAFTFAWTGYICLNSGEPDFTEQFWSFGLFALLGSYAAFFCSTLFPQED